VSEQITGEVITSHDVPSGMALFASKLPQRGSEEGVGVASAVVTSVGMASAITSIVVASAAESIVVVDADAPSEDESGNAMSVGAAMVISSVNEGSDSVVAFSATIGSADGKGESVSSQSGTAIVGVGISMVSVSRPRFACTACLVSQSGVGVEAESIPRFASTVASGVGLASQSAVAVSVSRPRLASTTSTVAEVSPSSQLVLVEGDSIAVSSPRLASAVGKAMSVDSVAQSSMVAEVSSIPRLASATSMVVASAAHSLVEVMTSTVVVGSNVGAIVSSGQGVASASPRKPF
jgi:hypothetical protein